MADKRGYSWATATAGNTIAEKHRCWSRDVPEAAAELVEDLVGPRVYQEHPQTALRAAEVWVRIRRAETWLAEHGDLDEEGRPQPVLAALNAWDAMLIRLSDRLGLSPLSAARLDLLRGEQKADKQTSIARIEGLLDDLRQRDEKRKAAEEFRSKMPRPLGSPERLALAAGPPVVVEVVDEEERSPIDVLMAELRRRRDEGANA